MKRSAGSYIKARAKSIRAEFRRRRVLADDKIPIHGISNLPALVIAPHPDDETIAAGGFLALKARNNVPVYVVFLTTGEASHRHCCSISRETVGTIRKKQAISAAQKLGLRQQCLSFLSFQDGNIPGKTSKEFDDAKQLMRQTIQSLPVKEVLFPHFSDAIPDHSHCAEIVLEAIQTMHSIRKHLLYQYSIWSYYNLSSSEFSHLINEDLWKLDVTDVMNSKKEAMMQYVNSSKAPCNMPYIGNLPTYIFRLAEAKFELFWKCKSTYENL